MIKSTSDSLENDDSRAEWPTAIIGMGRALGPVDYRARTTIVRPDRCEEQIRDSPRRRQERQEK